MEMHQIRYFLAVSRAVNFTRAAEECNVSQPSLTRAIQMLEGELGGELFVRERGRTHLTELGSRMLPLIQQCYNSAATAKLLANSIKKGQVSSLKLALTLTINVAIALPFLAELSNSFSGLELKFYRGDALRTHEALEKGAVDLAVAGAPLFANRERLDHWTLFTERFLVAMNEGHHLANRDKIYIADLKDEHIIRRAHCEGIAELDSILADLGLASGLRHEAHSESDVAGLLAANLGVAIVPASAPLPENLRRISIEDFTQRRTISIFAVSGRSLSPAAGGLLKMLRAGDWSSYSAA